MFVAEITATFILDVAFAFKKVGTRDINKIDKKESFLQQRRRTYQLSGCQSKEFVREWKNDHLMVD